MAFPWRRTLVWLRRAVLACAALLALYLGGCAALLVLYKWVDPPTTGVQMQRRVGSWLDGGDGGGGAARGAYRKRYEPLPLERISRHVPRAVVAAEDARFFGHRGIDWQAIGEALEDRAAGRARGGSGITQQLVKNLFLTTHSTWLRKALEVPLAYMAEGILGKERILELYVNVVEWGPGGVFGIEAAARHHYGRPASALSREQAARLAACLPDPRRRAPQRMDRYSGIVQRRMRALGW